MVVKIVSLVCWEPTATSPLPSRSLVETMPLSCKEWLRIWRRQRSDFFQCYTIPHTHTHSLVPQAPPSFSMLHAENWEGAWYLIPCDWYLIPCDWYLIPCDSCNGDVARRSKNISLGKLSILEPSPWWYPLLWSLEGSLYTHLKVREYCFELERLQLYWSFVSPVLDNCHFPR